MRFKAILAEEARKRYPLSVLLMVMGVLVMPFPYLFIHFGLELLDFWWSALGICIGIVAGCLIVGLGSLVEDIHDISMHTVGFDLELGELSEEEWDEEPYEEETDEPEPEEAPAEETEPEADAERPEGQAPAE